MTVDDSNNLILVSVEAGVARLVINRPDKRNALTRSMIEQMLAAVQKLAGDESMRAVSYTHLTLPTILLV